MVRSMLRFVGWVIERFINICGCVRLDTSSSLRRSTRLEGHVEVNVQGSFVSEMVSMYVRLLPEAVSFFLPLVGGNRWRCCECCGCCMASECFMVIRSVTGRTDFKDRKGAQLEMDKREGAIR